MKKIFFICLAGIVLFSCNQVLAVKEISSGSNLTAKIEPSNPQAGEVVTISLQGYGFNIDTSFITWFVNGKSASARTGLKTKTFLLGRVGEKTEISAYVRASNGQSASKTFIFEPASLNLTWQAYSYVPPFYQGAALPSAGSQIKIWAIPYVIDRNGQKVDNKALLYQWSKNDIPESDASGLGRDIFSFLAGSGQQLKISLTVTTADTNNISAQKTLLINTVAPETLIYEYQPLVGPAYQKALGQELDLYRDNVSLWGETYYLPGTNPANFNYSWTINNLPAGSEPQEPRLINLLRQSNASGYNVLNFSALSPLIEIGANKSITVKYGGNILNQQP